ncbi:hypothetical protein C8J56DRAFT_1056772 [Mycena floridula]|nr:hypothetical protein C8J56DRAFT_1056772 [Mycena floridula]
MNSISWTEAIQASVSSCFPCFSSAPNEEAQQERRSRGRRPPQLQSLLTEPSSENEAETMSMHSAIGSQRKRKKKKGKGKGKGTITFFGFDLFGKRAGVGGIHLPDEDDALLRRPASSSDSYSGTYDSDAAQLDTAAIESFAGGDLIAAAEAERREAEEEERLAKEERRRKRREKKEMKKVALALAAGDAEAGFEGFQGSGDAYKAIPTSLLRLGASSPTNSNSSTASFRRQQQQQQPLQAPIEDEADLDGMLYARAPRNNVGQERSSSVGHSSSNSGSRVSHSSNPIPYPTSPALPPAPKKKKKKSATSHSSGSTHSPSVGSTRSPSSLGSPVSNGFPFVPSNLRKPQLDPEFEGVSFDDV